MCSVKKMVLACAAMTLCAVMLLGCGEDQPQKEAPKKATVQEQLGREAADSLQQPLEKARKAAQQAGHQANQLIDSAAKATNEAVNHAVKQADQVLEAVNDTTKEITEKSGGKEKKQLEGC